MASSASTASRKLSPRQATAVYAAGVVGFLLGLWALCAGLFAAVLGIAVEHEGFQHAPLPRAPVFGAAGLPLAAHQRSAGRLSYF
ncbi:hypothetical protein HaLaN_23377 [Haematococcus lacustris]|uniref:Uncharacterized protein n=1 Tax=Haematococcus lacustris TaxID=44745 RepID=A0A699ZRZ6_HAELA|nr:hypothetical protein HaLaN_23377 [Haematococcus lacustris]